jgi:outer membrane protein OmpA-like peptidoglycan-associated protein
MKARIGFLFAALLLAACQTTPPKPSPSPSPSPTPAPTATPEPSPTPAPSAEPSPDVSTITVSTDGFSPLAEAPHNTLSFDVHLGHPDAVTKWTVAVTGPNGLVRTVTGNKTIPAWTWDGTTDGPKLVDGTYHAKLTVAHGDQTETADSAPFAVDVTPPSGTVKVSPQPFTPNSEDQNKVTFDLDIKEGGAPIATWRVLVVHPDGRQFIDFISENHSDNKVVWDGHDQTGNTLEGGVTYKIVVQVVDHYGNTGTLNGSLPVTPGAVVAPVTVSLDGSIIGQLQIYFPAFSADMSQVDAAKAQANKAALDKLAGLLKNNPGSKIRVVGHANQVLWQDPAKARYEQSQTLIPLSRDRANAVLAALKTRDVDDAHFDVTGVGAEGNVVPFSDYANTWKNRRVEFIIER